MKYNLQIIFFLVSICQLKSQTISTDKLRVLTSELKTGLKLLCPDTGSPVAPNQNIDKKLIHWADEKNIRNIPDDQISSASLSFLPADVNDRFLFTLHNPMEELSCGFYFDKIYRRIKKWSFTYVNQSEVILETNVDAKYFKLSPYNTTFSRLDYRVSNETLLGLSQSRKTFRLDCKPNFDRPLIITTVLWLKYTRHGNAEISEIFQMPANSGTKYLDDTQIFEGVKRKIEFSTILWNLFDSPANEALISLQCVSFLDGFNMEAKSLELNILKGGSTGMVTMTSGGLSNLEIALISVFSILGLILLIGLILLLYCCCCGAWGRKRREENAKSKEKNKPKGYDVDGVEVPIRTLTSSEEERMFSNKNTQIISNNSDSMNKRSYRTTLHLDNINREQADKEFHRSDYINENLQKQSKHVTTLPNLQKNELTMIKDPNNSFFYSEDGDYSYIPRYNQDNYKKVIFKNEDYYEIKTSSMTKKLPSISGTMPYDLNFQDQLVHQV